MQTKLSNVTLRNSPPMAVSPLKSKPAHKRLARGFTLIEMMIVLAIAGLIATIALPQLRDVITGSKSSTAALTQSQIQSKYDMWTSLGGHHTATGGIELTEALITILTSPSYAASSDPSPVLVSVNGDSSGIVEPRSYSPMPGTIRVTLPQGAPIVKSIGGTSSLVYNGSQIISFTPTSANSGTWTVTNI